MNKLASWAGQTWFKPYIFYLNLHITKVCASMGHTPLLSLSYTKVQAPSINTLNFHINRCWKTCMGYCKQQKKSGKLH